MNQYPPPNAPYGQPPPQGYPQQPQGYPPQGYPQGYPQQPPPGAEDESQLNILSICHFVYGGLIGVFGLIGLLYVVFGIFLATASMGPPSAPGGPPPAAIGGIVAAMGGFITLFLWIQAACVIYSGFSLRKHQRRIFSIVVACFCMMNVPLGTALGIFTLIVLVRASVKGLYDRVAYYGS